MKPANIGDRTRRDVATVTGLSPETMEVLVPTAGQRLKAAWGRRNLESLYDTYVVRGPGNPRGHLVNVVRGTDRYLELIAGLLKVAGIAPIAGPLIQGTFGLAFGGAAYLVEKADVGDTQHGAMARLAAGQLALAAIGLGQDVTMPGLATVVRGFHNGAGALGDFGKVIRPEAPKIEYVAEVTFS